MVTETVDGALDALDDLIRTAHGVRAGIFQSEHRGIDFGCCVIVAQLEACKSQLSQNPDYLTTAWAFIDAARRRVSQYKQVTAVAEVPE